MQLSGVLFKPITSHNSLRAAEVSSCLGLTMMCMPKGSWLTSATALLVTKLLIWQPAQRMFECSNFLFACCPCRPLISSELFEEAASQQGPLPTGQAVWKEVRGRMAAAAGARKALAEECPASSIGALLAILLQQVSNCQICMRPSAK